MVGEQLWAGVQDYAEMAATFFFKGNHADAADSVQDAAVLCLELPGKYPDRPMEELVLIAKRSIWNKCIDAVRRKPMVTLDPMGAARGSRTTEYSNGCLMREPSEEKPNERSVEAAEIMAHIAGRLDEGEVSIMKLCAEGHQRQEIAARTGLSRRWVQYKLEKIRTVARRYDY